MLALAFWLLCAAAAVGGGLAVAYVRGPAAKLPPSAILVTHGLLGAASLGALLLALNRGLPWTGFGTAGFGPTAAILLALALALGLRVAWLTWLGRRPSELLVGSHAGLAIAGLVLVLTLVALR